MMAKKLQVLIIRMILMFLLCFNFSGCIKYYQMLPGEFPQGKEKQASVFLTTRYVKSARIYDQFVTSAIFDVLWLSDEVRAAYAKNHCSKRGVSVDDADACIARQCEENKHWSTFYVLADVRDRRGISLSDKNAPWAFYLSIGDYKTEPLSVKEIELEPEFQRFFGQRFNLFKAAYVVKFPLRDAAGKHSAHKSEAINFVIESVDKSVTLTWKLNDNGQAVATKKKVLRDEDFYWG